MYINIQTPSPQAQIVYTQLKLFSVYWPFYGIYYKCLPVMHEKSSTSSPSVFLRLVPPQWWVAMCDSLSEKNSIPPPKTLPTPPPLPARIKYMLTLYILRHIIYIHIPWNNDHDNELHNYSWKVWQSVHSEDHYHGHYLMVWLITLMMCMLNEPKKMNLRNCIKRRF